MMKLDITLGSNAFNFEGSSSDSQFASASLAAWIAAQDPIDPADLAKIVEQSKKNNAALEANKAKLEGAT